STSYKNKKVELKPVDQTINEDSDEYEFGKDIKDEKKRKVEEIRKEIQEIKCHLSKKKKDKTEDEGKDDEPCESQLPVDPL
ncbi:hypothetical protein NL492_27285, partial [Klebsiella pneumoniae]|nr:hypothetical protein [Klebsiella pneumoniae]